MHSKTAPTTKDNVAARLFLRHFLFYIAAACLGLLLCHRGLLSIDLHAAGAVSFAMIPLALLAGLLTLARPYLLALTAAKALFDAAMLTRITAKISTGAIGILSFNACFFLLAFSLVLFCVSAARACWFAFGNRVQDAALLFSRAFWRYVAEAMILTALALSLYFLWPRLPLNL